MEKKKTTDGMQRWSAELKAAQELEEQAVTETNIQCLRGAQRAVCFLVMLREIYEAQQARPDKKLHIDGKSGIARALDVTRNGVYCRLAELGLVIADFRSATSLDDLLERSRFRNLKADLRQFFAARKGMVK